ncbi:MAG TPA: peptidoglycan DD-metalloendopeptidase family protein [Ferruginibacter sp.]|mgnify:CR=1 FL=1|nr:peptidoglycan DD-metalloendopeptidase family protein [Ferruginibacter sp.]HMP21066.1 peptidoglycan DD-metalloendopeptidase family protein [Ferruginibacter sp.]
MNVLLKYKNDFHPVVEYNPATDKLYHFDFTAANTELTEALIADTTLFEKYISSKLNNSYKYGIGGYNEERILYKRSSHFNATANNTEPRTIHLGIDIWGRAGTAVYAPIGGMVHSTGFNNNFGDYGATIVLLHQLDGISFYTLYGHVSLPDIAALNEGAYISRGQQFASFGPPAENGNWPPHLHFQVIIDMQEKKGDYPGVCTKTEREKYLANCPDPNLILQML